MTQQFLAWVKARRESLKEDWANGAFTASLEAEMIARNAGATGACSVYSEILDLTHEDIFGDSE